jgi:hypothetical protein
MWSDISRRARPKAWKNRLHLNGDLPCEFI